MVRSRPFAVAALALVCLFSGLLQAFQTTFYVVDRVIDGDTVALREIGTVRLIGVDAPEPADQRPDQKAQGLAAKEFLKRLLANQMVRVEQEPGKKDKYGRTLAYLYLGDGTHVNAEIIKQGFGHAYTAVPFAQLNSFRLFEREARDAGKGLWAGAAQTSRSVQAPLVAPIAPRAVTRAVASTDTVYVTKTGAKYHRAGCRHLARSQIAMSLSDAATRYSACSVCRPPTSAGSAISTAPRSVAPPPAPTSGRCAATTRKGTQCSRRAQSGRAYCWQH